MTGKLGLVAIDEAHCISEWGHDFRPEYRRLGARSCSSGRRAPATLEQNIEAQLAAAASPLTAAALRKLCRVRNATLTAVLAELVATGRIRKDPTGYMISG